MTPEEAINRTARDLVVQGRKNGKPITFAEAREMVRKARAEGENKRNQNR